MLTTWGRTVRYTLAHGRAASRTDPALPHLRREHSGPGPEVPMRVGGHPALPRGEPRADPAGGDSDRTQGRSDGAPHRVGSGPAQGADGLLGARGAPLLRQVGPLCSPPTGPQRNRVSPLGELVERRDQLSNPTAWRRSANRGPLEYARPRISAKAKALIGVGSLQSSISHLARVQSTGLAQPWGQGLYALKAVVCTPTRLISA
jgi:hypothetical protein